MPYELIWEPRVAKVVFRGYVTATEFLDAAAHLPADYRFDFLQFVIVDFSSIEDHGIDAETVMDDLAVTSVGASATNPNIRTVVITTDSRLAELAAFMGNPRDDDAPDVAVFARGDLADQWVVTQPILSRFVSRFR